MHVFNVNLSYCCIQLLNMQQLMTFAYSLEDVAAMLMSIFIESQVASHAVCVTSVVFHCHLYLIDGLSLVCD